MPKIVVLGAGMVGSVIASDLASSKGYRVTVADRSSASLARAESRTQGRAQAIEADLGDPKAVIRLVKDADLVVGALPSIFGFRVLQAIVERGLRYCDISFMPEDFLELDRLAKRTGAVCVADCGVAPGMSNLLSAWGVSRLDRAERVDIMVGGIPRERRWPFEYKAGFAPSDVLEEYVRPARVVEHGKVVIKEALSEPELLEFEGIGTLEAFNTDGLRSLATTLKVPHMRERTMRYPGHIELMRVFRETGLFSLDEVDVNGVRVRPRDLLAKLLFPKWTYADGEVDLTVMRVVVEGILGNSRARLTWDLFDHLDSATGYTSMSRTTAFPCTSVGRMILDRTISAPGVHPPERLITINGLLDRVLKDLRTRGIEYRASVEQDSSPRSKPGRASRAARRSGR